MLQAIIGGTIGGLIVVAGLWSMARWEERQSKKKRTTGTVKGIV